MSNLAINGGKSIRNSLFPQRQLYDKEIIKKELSNLIDSNNLSGYRGSFGQHFWGGENVRRLEEFFADYLYQKNGEQYHVLAINSCTSALQVACGAIGLKPWEEVIVTPWSMTCSATAPSIYGAIPSFVDIEKDYFCLDYESIEEQITEKTKAIIIVDLFGLPYDVERINAIAKKHNLYIIEDAAQAIGSSFKEKQAGTLGDIGCFSFTQGKHFTCGEGGFIVTKDQDLYFKCALIRNHAEAVINSMPEQLKSKYADMINQHGFNLRMTEMQAIILYHQLQHIEEEVNLRIKNVQNIKNRIKLPGIEWAKVRPGCTHSYYILPFLFDEKKVGISRHKFITAVQAELRIEKTSMGITSKIEPLIWEKYITPIYDMPIFEYKYYGKKNLPNVTDLQENKFCMTSYQALPLEAKDLDDIQNAFCKVYENIGEIK